MIYPSRQPIGVTPVDGAADTTTRGSPVAGAVLLVLATAIAILGSQSWSNVVYVVFTVVIAALARPHIRRSEVLRMALAIGGSIALTAVGFYCVVASPMQPFPELGPIVMLIGTGPILLLAGISALIGAAALAVGSVRYIRQRGRAQLLLPSITVLVVGWFAFLLVDNPGSGAVVETGGMAAVIGVLRRVPENPRLLRAAVFAQAADLGMFGFVWQLGQGERNPLGRWTIETLLALGPNDAYAAVAAGMVLIMAKLALIGFLIQITPDLGRYRRAVLAIATLAGTGGVAASVLTRLP